MRVAAAAGDDVGEASPVVVIESMKMEHVVPAGGPGRVGRVAVAAGDQVQRGDLLVVIADAAPAPAPAPGPRSHRRPPPSRPPSPVSPRRLRRRPRRPTSRPPTPAPRSGPTWRRWSSATGSGSTRPGPTSWPSVTERGNRTARENLADLVDDGSYVEYGALAIAAQRRRRPVDELIARTPADGMLAGVGTVDGVPTAVLSYDYTVLAGTQGFQNHRKKDRLFDVIERRRLPVVFFAEGGGGRPGDTDSPGVSGLDCLAFGLWGGLSGLVPRVAIVNGRCFAGNAALAGSSDLVIATEGSNLGMGGPAMIEGGGLGTFAPEDIGPLDVQVANGVVDVAVADEAEAVAVAKRYLSYFAGPTDDWSYGDPHDLRDLIPENRRTAYDVRTVVHGLADADSVLELRPSWGVGMVTALARVEGRPLGIVANNPVHLAGAIDADGADKAARFLQLCDAFDLPVLFLCDTPGIMVGRRRGHRARAPRQPAVRRRGQPRRAVRHDHPAQGLRAGRPDDGRRQLQVAAVLRGVAHRRGRGHGVGGGGAPRVPPRARGHRRPGRARGSVPVDGRRRLRVRQGAQLGLPLRDRRRHRPRRLPPVGLDAAHRRRHGLARPGWAQAAVRRHLVAGYPWAALTLGLIDTR